MTLLELFQLMRKHLRLVVALPVACALVTAVICYAALPNTYTASVSMYVLTKASTSDEQGTVSNSDLAASQMLTSDVATIIKSDRVSADTAEALNMSSLDDYKISIDSSTTTRVITLSVVGPTPDSAAAVANQVAVTTDAIAQQVMNVESINVIDQASAPPSPSGPPRLMYTAVAFLAGLFAAIAVVVVMDMANTRVRGAEEASQLLEGMPIIGRIPIQKA